MNLEESMKYVKEELDAAEKRASVVMEDAKIIDSTESNIIVALIHLIKYDVIKYRQDTDWIHSINAVNLNKAIFNKSNLNKCKREFSSRMDELYAQARYNAKFELVKKKYPNASDISPVERPGIYTFDFLLDQDAILEYLKKNAYSHEMRIEFGLSTKLTKDEEEIKRGKYTLDQAFPGVKLKRF